MKRAPKPYKAAPSILGTLSCPKQHKWNVRDLNPERQAVNCPVCGTYTSITQGLEKTSE